MYSIKNIIYSYYKCKKNQNPTIINYKINGEYMSNSVENLEENRNQGKSRWILILLIGLLSMFIPEVFAGSSGPIWFLNPVGLILAFPLYLFHSMLFINLAVRTKKTSIPQLYLWGVIFGLYESWITKVLWYGFPGSPGPIFGYYLGVAILEFSILVLFWHPVFAFVIPILVYESFTDLEDSSTNIENKIFMSHLPYLTSTKRNLFVYIFLIVVGASFLTRNSGYNIFAVVISIVGSVALTYLLFKLGRRKNHSISIYSLQLGKKGFSLVIVYIILLYLITFFILLPEKLPTSAIPYLTIIGFYVFVEFMIFHSIPTKEKNVERKVDEEKIIPKMFFFKLFGLFLIIAIIFCLLPPLGMIIQSILAPILVFGAPVLFLFHLIKALKGKD